MKDTVEKSTIKPIKFSIDDKNLKPKKVVGKTMNVAIDPGKNETKAECGEIQIHFKTRVRRHSNLSQVDSKEAFVAILDGEAYVVGDDVNTEPDLDMSKQTIEHKVCVYSAIAKLVPNGSVVNLVVGIPALLFLDQETRLDYENYMGQPLDKEWIEITLDGESHYFKINKVKALPETSGYLFKNYQNYIDGLVGIIDIGGLNINACIYNALNPVHKMCFTINNGGHHLRTDIQQRLIQKLHRDIQNVQMDGILRKPKPSEEPIIKEVVGEYMTRLVKELRRRNWDISEDGIPMVLTGGTSMIVGRYAHEYFPQLTVSQDPIFDNVSGFQVYAAAFLGE